MPPDGRQPLRVGVRMAVVVAVVVVGLDVVLLLVVLDRGLGGGCDAEWEGRR